MDFLRDGSVLVLGLGESGLAMARWCVLHGAAVQVWDSRAQPPQAATLRTELPQVRVYSGDLGAAVPAGVRLVLKSPGLAPHDARIAPLLAAARASGVAVMAELDLFMRALADVKARTAAAAPQALRAPEATEEGSNTAALEAAQAPAASETSEASEASETAEAAEVAEVTEAATADDLGAADALAVMAPPPPDPAYAPQVLAVTGTNGKTTTTALTALLVARAGRRVAAAGNIGPSLLDALTRMLQTPRAQWIEVWVLELSSFQLADAQGFEPSAGAVLNLTQDHLDWHGDMAAYAAAKARVFGQRATMIVNRDDAAVEAMVPAPAAVKVGRGKPAPVPRPVLRFGLGAPTRPGDFGLVQEGGMAWLVRALPVDETLKRRKDEVPEIHLQRLMPADALRVRGRHNAANALAALALATAIGCPLAPMLHGLREYTGEPHRVQGLGLVGGVAVYDDSKGTNVGATVAALQGLGAEQAPGRLVLILGGQGKGQDFAALAEPVARHARAVALIGADAARIGQALEACGVPLQAHATLPEAVAWCFAQAEPGDAVLLSPACASLDQFRNYAHRAEVFAAAVQALAAERGELL